MKTNKMHLYFLSLKKNLTRFCMSVCLLAATPLMAFVEQNLNNLPSTALVVGTPAAFLQKTGVKNVAEEQINLNLTYNNTQSSRVPARFTLMDNLGNEIEVIADNFLVEVDGTLSIDGKVEGLSDSEFILQGNEERVYGWLILRDRDIAYEYTTVEGQLVVSEIEITDVHPICDFQHHNLIGANSGKSFAFPSAAASSSHIGTYPGTHVGQLESRPGSSYVILIDTSKVMSNGVPYDVSKEFIWTTWQIVAASFSMLDVNVTTNRDVYNNAAPSKRGGATMYRQTGRSSCHFAFGTSTFCTLYKESTAYGQGRIAAHEIGHLLHLAHDGGAPGGEYHNGISAYQWVPVMGNIWMGTNWNHALYQWSKGEYSGASNREDDFAKMNTFIPFKADDIAGTKALVVSSNGTVSGANNTGQIERNTDSDSFSFNIGASGGRINLTIDRTEHIGGGMLDVQAYIKDSAGNIVAQSNKSVNRSAAFNQDLATGNYTLEITGGAEGTPSNGFSKYSSVGYYAIEGSITGGGSGGGDVTPSITNLANGATLSGSSQLFNWNAGTATAFKFSAGSSQGADNYYNDNTQITGSSHTVTGLPTDGSTVHITFHYLMNGTWSKLYYTYLAKNDNAGGELGVTSPVDGATLTGASQTFTWNPGQATGFWFYAGSSRGAQDYYRNPSQLSGTSHTVTGLPTDGSTVYITFHHLSNGSWSQLHYTYTAANNGGGCTAAPATPNKPVNTANSSTGFTADWNSVSGATSYGVQLWVNDSAWQTVGTATQSEYAFTGLAAGSTQYVRVRATNSCGSSNYSQWSSVSLSGGGCTSAPAVPSGLSGSSQTISWGAVSGATRYDVQYWTGVWTNRGSTSATSYNLGLSGTQYVRVRAANSCGNSNYSGWVTVY